MTDEELAGLVAAGDEPAFEELYARHKKHLFTFSLRFLGNSALAQDASQEALLSAYRHIKHFQPGKGSFRHWLYSIVYHECCRISRRRKSYLPIDDSVEFLGSREPKMVSDPTAGLALEAALLRLPLDYRLAVILTKVHGLTALDAARVLGISSTNAKQRVFRGLSALREMLSSPHGGTGPAGSHNEYKENSCDAMKSKT
jgi:RNA polymerase sigma-70 factor, ECF subfamily